jgi:perosamine synthetase
MNRSPDAIIGLLLLILLSPLLVFVAAANWAFTRRVIFRQVRLGMALRPFVILKFQTMVDGPAGASTVTAGSDRRLTGFGRILRATKLDELPQLINVVRGEMNLVGPRALTPNEVARIPPTVAAQVYALRPGLTGLASLIFSDEERILGEAPHPEEYYFRSVLPQKMALELAYVRRQGFWTNLLLLAATPLTIVLPGATRKYLLRLFRHRPPPGRPGGELDGLPLGPRVNSARANPGNDAVGDIAVDSLPVATDRIPLSRPDISEAEVQEVLSVLRTPVLSLGPKLREFEERMASFLDVRHTVAVSSGTAALHLAIRAAGIDEAAEVITTPFSFIASSNVLLFERAVPVFVDVDEQTLNLTPEAVDETIRRLYTPTRGGLVNRHSGRLLRGILPVDVFGLPVDIEGFRAITEHYRVWLVEDACEALGSEVYSRGRGAWVKVGALADASAFAFYPNKQLTTGEGGLVATNDQRLADRCRMERNQGRLEGSAWLEHAMLGFNYRMDELSAALGVAQLKRFDQLLRKRREVAGRYERALGGTEEIVLPQAGPGVRVNWFVYVVRLAPQVDREALSRFLAERGIESRAYFPAIHLQPPYRERFGYQEGAFPVCERIAHETLALPFFNDLTEDAIGFIARTLREGVHLCVAAQS